MTNEQIITEIGFDGATDEVKSQMIDNIRQIVEMRVIGILGEMMSDEQSEAFQSIVDAGDDQAVWDWLRETIVGADVSEVYEAALKDYLEDFKSRQPQIELDEE